MPANKYCNLYGQNKIKDDYDKINVGFAAVEVDVSGVLASEITRETTETEREVNEYNRQLRYENTKHYGEYDPAFLYHKNNIASSGGSSFMLIVDESVGNAPPIYPATSNTYWNLVGLKGDKGDTGEVPNITVGTTTTLNAGSSATVTRRVGSPDVAPIIDFGIPKGFDGGDVTRTEFDAHLSDNAKYIDFNNQLDYVQYLAKSASIKSKMNVQILVGNLKQFFINVPISDTQGIAYGFRKDGNDDYITFMDGALGTINPIYSIVNSKNYETKTGTFVETNAPNYYTSTIGDLIIATFIGTKISFNSYCNNQGGLWRFILDEGTAGQQQVDISVYSASPVAVKPQTIFQGLDNRKHTIKAVFQGQDPSNPIASPRGWYYFGGTRVQDTYRTFDIYNDTFNIIQTTPALYHYSNKDIALSCRPFESTGVYNFIPEHNAIGTAFNLVDTRLLVDGKDVIWNTDNYYTDIETVQLIQKVKGVHPSDLVNPIMELTTIHTIKNGVVTISGKVKFLRKTSIDVGYTCMLPYFTSFAKKIKTSTGNEYAVITDNPMYKEYWSEGDIKSVCVVNNVDVDEKADIAIAMTVENFDTTNRKSEVGIGDPFSWIEHRSDIMGKVYFQQFKNAVMEIGDEYRFDMKFVVCRIPKVNQYVLS